jgi:cyclophilin family peptidyl-prolyl cis-trans isomerase/HEAT repeat protein
MIRHALIAIVAAGTLQAQASSLRERMLAAEDARASSASEMAPLLQGLRGNDSRLLLQAVRALGRFERPSVVTQLLPFVTHRRADVRAEALNAIGQALASTPPAAGDAAPLPPEAATVTRTLFARLKAETDPYVVGVAAETLGRVPYRTAEALGDAETALAALLPVPQGAQPAAAGPEPRARVLHPASVMGAVKALETRARIHRKLAAVQPMTIARLRSAATLGSDPSDTDFAVIRRLAWSALNAAGNADIALVDAGLEDPDSQVRRLAVAALGNPNVSQADRSTRLLRALRDSSFMVRYDALRVYNRTLQPSGCAPVLAAVDDRSMHVALAAIDALGDGCPAGPSPIAKLIQLADALAAGKPARERAWHRPAHAFVALARVARDHAAGRMPAFAEHPIWQVRLYAARAAAAIGSETRLERLAGDAHDNVREAAITGLVSVRGHGADAFYIGALGRPDYQLVLTAANALKGSPNRDRVVPELIKAFARLTAEKRDTSRDPRVAILERLKELGDKRHLGAPAAAAIQSCPADFDPVVAQQCALVLTAWTGTPHAARPATRPRAGQGFAEAGSKADERRRERRARIAMKGGGAFELQLFAEDAPATVARFLRLARQGYYNGLTFHRVVPNFVLQGGSPGANEYMGDGPFMRDEVGLRTHARGTLGISTRGRDTGDAQIFINLVDNPRLDHHYTVFAAVAAGMDVVDHIIEGDVIERVDVLEPASSESRR